jgi:FkbM family methyltransferase
MYERIKSLYDKLQDDESQRLFFLRLQLSLCCDSDNFHPHNYLKPGLLDMGGGGGIFVAITDFERERRSNLGDNTSALFYDFVLNYKPKTKVVLYGSGHLGKLVYRILEDWNIPVECFCESIPICDNVCGVPVISAETLIKEYKAASIIICIGSRCPRLNVYNFLLKNEFKNTSIISTFSSTDQYFGYNFFPPIQDEIYVDVGSDDGNTIIDYNNVSQGCYKKIIALEPDAGNIRRINKNLNNANIKRLQLVAKGAWSSNTELLFEDLGNGSSKISNKGLLTISVIKLDDLLNDISGNIVIKMDVEGSELEALKGAEKTIIKNKPRLAICIYHKPEDILDIPLYISKIVPEYKFFIRHNCLVNLTETVLYAVI